MSRYHPHTGSPIHRLRMRWAGSYHHQNCLDPCGTKLNTKSRAILKNCCFCLIYSHCKKPPILFAEIHAVPSQLILQIPDRCIAININRFNPHSCCFPVTLATEAIAFFHQSLDRKSRKLFQGAQITKVCYDSLIIFSPRGSAQNRSRSLPGLLHAS